jgi:hypothetical protein
MVALAGPPAHLSEVRLPEYLPDRTEPVDRWYQAANSSNVRTTRRIIEDIAGGRPRMVVDPFAGAGSAAVVARLLSVPFFGIELNPILAAVTLAKARATAACARQLPAKPGRPLTGDLTLACLDLVRELRAQTGDPLSVSAMVSDLERAELPVVENAVVHGDATDAACWDRNRIPRVNGPALIYCSPPFGETSPRPRATTALDRKAERLLSDAQLSHCAGPVGRFASYIELVVGMLRNVETAFDDGVQVIVEHEPSDRPSPAERELVVAEIQAKTSMRDVRVEELGSFSRRGVLSLIIGEIPPRRRPR